MAGIAIPPSISEEYYQISEAILESFPKYRLPLDLFVFDPGLGQLVSYARKDTRFQNAQVAEIRRLCAEGDLFVSRADHPVYSRHIVKQLDLILVDRNLKDAEVADISLRALDMRLRGFFDQTVQPVFDRLRDDVLVVTEFLWADPHRLRLFMRRLRIGEYSLASHSINTFSVGLWLLMETRGKELERSDFDQAALALLLHDVGMAKVPAFITGKTLPLKNEEREKLQTHTLDGYRIVDKLGLSFDRIRQATLEHHERLDGSGYTQGSKKISQFGRLVAVADAFSAMIQNRPYARAKDMTEAARELTEQKDRFDFSLTSRIMTALASKAFGKSK